MLNGGKVKTLLILGGNPVYNAPADLDFAEALAKVPTTIHLSLLPRRDVAALHLARAAGPFPGSVGRRVRR